jgi:hypothetical protein
VFAEDLRCKRSSEIVVFWTSVGEGAELNHPRVAQSSVRSSLMSAIVVRVPGIETEDESVEELRPRHCVNPDCNAVFSVCRRCDRGQRYCSDSCRKRMRRQQVLAAGRRYQASPAGKEAHRHRQCAYRQRQSEAPVTHQGPAPITISRPVSGRSLTQCAVCARSSQWMNPFYLLRPRRRRPPRISRTTDVQKRRVCVIANTSGSAPTTCVAQVLRVSVT